MRLDLRQSVKSPCAVGMTQLLFTVLFHPFFTTLECNKYFKLAPVPDNEKAKYWGDYNECDLPTWTLDEIFREVSETHGSDVGQLNSIFY